MTSKRMTIMGTRHVVAAGHYLAAHAAFEILEAGGNAIDAGVAAGPCLTAQQVIDDQHVAARNMLMEIPRPEGGDPVLTPGNPIKMSRVSEGPDVRMPWLGEHTNEVLAAELGLDDARIEQLRTDGVIA